MPLLSTALLGYMWLLGILATASPGVGLLGAVLLHLPSQVLDCLHAPAYGFLTWLVATALQRRGWPLGPTLLVASLFSLVFGFWTETLQLSVPGRGLQWRDLVSDGIGIMAASMLVVRRAGHACSIRQTPAGSSFAALEEST